MNAEQILEAMADGQQAREAKRAQNPCPIRGSASGKCPRELGLALEGLPKTPISDRSLRIFELGTSRGEGLAASLEAGLRQAFGKDVDIRQEEEVWTPILGVENARQVVDRLKDMYGEDAPVCMYDGLLHVRSRIDAVVEDFRTQDVHVVEFKTAHSFKIKNLEKEGIDDAYQAQVLMQAAGLRQTGYSIGSIWVVYEDKSDCSLHPVEMKPNPQLLQATVDRIAMVLNMWYAGNAHQIEHGKEGDVSEKTGKLPWQCDYCSIGPLAGGCWPAERLTPRQSKDMIKWHLSPDISF